MTRFIWALVATASALLLFVPEALAQQAGATDVNVKELLATLLNTAGVMIAVQGIKLARPYLADRYGWALPILAMVLGPVMAALQTYLAAKLGYAVDFSLITAALTGGAAVAANQIYRQAKEGPTGPAMRRP